MRFQVTSLDTAAQARPTAPTANLAIRILRARWFPGIFQFLGIVTFILILWFAFTGNPHGELNFATVLTWRLWWAVLPLSLFVVGKAWCAMCPLATLSDLTQKFSPLTRVTPRWLREGEHGVWVMAGAFLTLSWAHAIFDIHGTPWLTGVVFSGLALSAIVLALRYERRAFCRFVCPIGLMSGIYAMTSPVALRASDNLCRVGCGKKSCTAAPDCKLYEYPRTMDSNRYCVLCGDCVKTCEHNSPQFVLRMPTRELAEIRKPVFAEAIFVILLLGLVVVEVFRMTPFYPLFMQEALLLTQTDNYTLVYSAALLILLTVFVVGAIGAARFVASSWRTNLARFGYAFVPLALAGHLGTNLFELYAEGTRSIQTVIDNLNIPLQLFDMPPMVRGAIYAYRPDLMIVQFGVLALGLFATLIVIRRLARKTQTRALPYALFAIGIATIFFALYASPMKPGC